MDSAAHKAIADGQDAAGAPTAADAAAGIGAHLAAVRTRRGLKVSELARRIGVSASLISQIERGHSRPSVSTLFALAEELAVPVDAFFRGGDGEAAEVVRDTRTAPRERSDGPPGADRYLVRRTDRALIDIEGGLRWERLTPTTMRDVDFLELVYGPHAESSAALYRHPGIEMILVLEGRLVIVIAFERYELDAGDSMCFPSITPHQYLNPTAGTTRAVTVILPDGDGAHPEGTRRP
jgi:transcriptional regulator with XRE-family HTH domain